MCWVSNKLRPLSSSKENTPIYKIVRVNATGGLEAYFRGSDYVLNQLYEEELGHYFDPFICRHFISEGIHCYSTACKFKRSPEGIFAITKDLKILYAEGEISLTGKYYKAVVVEGYIPADSEYFENENQEIVTTKIVLTNVLDI